MPGKVVIDMDFRPAGRKKQNRPGHKSPVETVELPPGLAPRIAAALALADVAGQGRNLDDALTASFVHPKVGAVLERDRPLVRSIVVVALRRLGTLRHTIGQLLERGWPRKSGTLEWILLITAAQILFLDTADHAAVNACVQAVRLDPAAAPYASLANAVARNLARGKDQFVVTDPLLDVPSWLATRWRKAWGEEAAIAIAAANRTEAPLDLTVKSDPQGWAEKLGGDVLATGSVRLKVSTPVPELPGYDEGAWWVQDAAAALPAKLLRIEPGERVVDLCAAPGGKAAQLCAAGANVVAVDRSAERLKRFTLNLERLGYTADAKVADAAAFQAPVFDGVLLDAPCTATGTMRRHPDIAWTKRASDIPTLATLQTRMLDRAASLVRPGGRLVYCVCSLEPEEGEAQVAALLRRNPDLSRSPIGSNEVGGLTQSLTPLGELRTLPYHPARLDPLMVGLDGFYAARLMRRG